MMGFPSRTKGFYQRESASAASLLRTYALTDAQEYFADCFVYWIKIAVMAKDGNAAKRCA